jgi:O-succinylbenzoic acid--CoA ligase
MTETVSHIALQPVNGPEASEYFKVLPGIRIEIDERGCLKINVPFLKEEITTTDIVEIKSATEFKWLGRSDSVINSAGVKIIPEKLEAQIANVFINLDLANRFVISSIPDPVLGNKLVLLIEGNLPISGDRLSSALQQALPRYHNPKQIIVNATLVMAENGKINRDETRKKNWDLTREND